MRLSLLLLALCLGICGAGRFSLPLCYTGAALFVCAVMGCWSRRNYYFYALLFFLGLFWAGFRSSLPSGFPAEGLYELTADGNGRSGRLTAWRDEAGTWHGTDLRVRLYGADSVAAGRSWIVAERFRRFDSDTSVYARRMRRRGYAGALRLHPGNLIPRAADTSAAHRSLHAIAVERVRRIPLTPDARVLVTALATGERSDFRPALREAYIRSGNAHLLAVSGLHIGIFYLLIETLSAPLLLFYRGNRWRNFAVFIGVWVYVAATGFTVSAVRAALMFSIYLAMRRNDALADSGRVLTISALTMLIVNPLWLYDVGFQLSFTAMAGILFWGVPLNRRLHCRFGIVNRFVGLTVVAVTATLATAPLVAHYFGRVSLLSFLLAAPTLLLSTAILALALFAMLLPALHPVIAPLLDSIAFAQNSLVLQVSSLPFASFTLHLSALQTLLIYLLLLGLRFALKAYTDTDEDESF